MRVVYREMEYCHLAACRARRNCCLRRNSFYMWLLCGPDSAASANNSDKSVVVFSSPAWYGITRCHSASISGDSTPLLFVSPCFEFFVFCYRRMFSRRLPEIRLFYSFSSGGESVPRTHTCPRLLLLACPRLLLFFSCRASRGYASKVPYMVVPGNHEAECHSPACLFSRRKLRVRSYVAGNTRVHRHECFCSRVLSELIGRYD